MKFYLVLFMLSYVSGYQGSLKEKDIFKGDKPMVWTPELIHQLKSNANRISSATNFWIDSILGRFINEFTLDLTVSYNEAE